MNIKNILASLKRPPRLALDTGGLVSFFAENGHAVLFFELFFPFSAFVPLYHIEGVLLHYVPIGVLFAQLNEMELVL